MRFYRFLLTLLIGCTYISTVQAQSLKSFSPDPVKFPKELESFFNESNGKEAEDMLKAFNELWKNKKFSVDEMDDIYRTTNQMLVKRMKPFPDFKNYINVLISFAKSKQSAASMDGFQVSIDTLLHRPNKFFNSFINTCNLLFTENSLYSSASTRWRVNSEGYVFAYDTLPKVIFEKMDLTCISKGDSATIYGTKGVYYPSKNLWIGSNGTVYWDRAGVSRDTVFADLKKYKIEMDGSDYVADSVSFTHKGFFKAPVKGKLTDKILVISSPDKATYPKFDSYNSNMQIKNIAPDVDYKGGFSMSGNRLLGSNATVVFYRNKKPFILTKSKSYLIKPDKIAAQNCTFKMYVGANDSITHPNLEIRLLKDKKEVTITRSDLGASKSPFYNTYHQVDMFFEQIKWVMGDTTLTFKMTSGADYAKAEFESSNYYRENKFDRIQTIAETNPLLYLKQYAEKINNKTFSVVEFSKFFKQSESQTRLFVIDMSNQGFVYYDYDTDILTVRDKVQFYLSAKRAKTDYDMLSFTSTTGGQDNAYMSLKNFNLKLKGVSKIFVSDSQNVYFRPRGKEIIIRKNRNFTCDGSVFAGRFELYGNNFAFDYDKFKVSFEGLDSVRFKIPGDKPNASGYTPLVMCKSVIEKVSGEVLIDHPMNKSGLKQASAFPVFNSVKPSFVYYDQESVQGGVYKRNRDFKFELKPFTIDSLDNFTKEGVAFKGEFSSASIFPNFIDTLKLQPDFSLGFVRQTPTTGFPAYKGKGQYFATIDLSHEGLRGDGKLDYLSSTARSNNFIFLPDSTNALVQDYQIRKEAVGGVAFPSVSGKDVYMHWEPYNDMMLVKQTKEPFDMYDNKAKLTGELTLRPKGLTGNGTIAYDESELQAHLMKFEQNAFESDTANFRLKSPGADNLAFASTNVHARIDLEKRKADFKSNNNEDYVQFPINQYIGYYDKFTWLMDQKAIDFGGADKSGRGFEFVSVKPGQDSLRFNAPSAIYSLVQNTIATKGIDHIDIADAAIYPDSGRVVIEKEAMMRTLEKAKVIANRETKYHTMFDATLNIAGRYSYSGKGLYDIVNKKMNFKKTVLMSSIGVDSLRTVASGTISDSADFALSPQIAYKGAVHLQANDSLLTYSGFGKIKSKCLPEASWFRFSGRLSTDSLTIPINDFTDDKGNFLAAAIGFVEDSTAYNLKGLFLAKQTGSTKDEIISSKGFLTYNKGEFRIGSLEKIADPENEGGNYLALREQKCMLYGEGDYKLSSDFGQLNMRTIGNGTYNYADASNRLEGMVMFDFMLNDAAWKALTDDIAGLALDPSDSANVNTQRAFKTIMGKEKAEEYSNEIMLYGTAKNLPKEMVHSMVFNNVRFKWDSFNTAFRSEGKFDLMSIQKEQINKIFTGKIEVYKKHGRDVLNIYLESDELGWYYFNYENGTMQVISSNETFNDAISNVKADKAVLKADKGLPEYRYVLSTDKKKNEFLRKVNYKSGK